MKNLFTLLPTLIKFDTYVMNSKYGAIQLIRDTLGQGFLTFFAPWTPRVSLGTTGVPLKSCERGIFGYITSLL